MGGGEGSGIGDNERQPRGTDCRQGIRASSPPGPARQDEQDGQDNQGPWFGVRGQADAQACEGRPAAGHPAHGEHGEGQRQAIVEVRVRDGQLHPCDEEHRAADEHGAAQPARPGGEVRPEVGRDGCDGMHQDQAGGGQHDLRRDQALIGSDMPEDLGDPEGQRPDLELRLARVQVQAAGVRKRPLPRAEQQLAALGEERPGDAAVGSEDDEPDEGPAAKDKQMPVVRDSGGQACRGWRTLGAVPVALRRLLVRSDVAHR